MAAKEDKKEESSRNKKKNKTFVGSLAQYQAQPLQVFGVFNKIMMIFIDYDHSFSNPYSAHILEGLAGGDLLRVEIKFLP